MRKSNETLYDSGRLIDGILAILLRNGIKATTMDEIALKLSVSKRTLYEVFDNKIDMAVAAMNRFHENLLNTALKFHASADSVMDTIMTTFIIYRDYLREMNVDFLRDFDNLPAEIRVRCEEAEHKYISFFHSLLDMAAEEGYIRADLNYRLKFRITQIQLTQVKKMAEVYPPDISLLQVYDTTALGFLRGISSPKGLKAIDSRLHLFDAATKQPN